MEGCVVIDHDGRRRKALRGNERRAHILGEDAGPKRPGQRAFGYTQVAGPNTSSIEILVPAFPVQARTRSTARGRISGPTSVLGQHRIADALRAIADLDLDEIAAIEPPRGFGRD